MNRVSIPFAIRYISHGVSETFTARTVQNGHEAKLVPVAGERVLRAFRCDQSICRLLIQCDTL
jgi:hypothetical protein